MSPKVAKKAAASKSKAPAPKAAGKPAKAGKAAAPAAKAAKGGKAAAAPSPAEGDGPQVDLDELEEQEDAAAAAASGGGGGDQAALAAANGSGEMSASFKNFRHHPDMENFYRFIYENDLRHEALAIIDVIMVEKLQRKALRAGKH